MSGPFAERLKHCQQSAVRRLGVLQLIRVEDDHASNATRRTTADHHQPHVPTATKEGTDSWQRRNPTSDEGELAPRSVHCYTHLRPSQADRRT